MPAHSDGFGKAFREAYARLGFQSYGQAQVRLGIDRAALYRMSKGEVPGRGLVTRWAAAIGEPVNKWLALAGHPLMPTEPVKTAGSEPPGEASQATESQQPEVPEAVREAIQDAPTREEKIQLAFDYLRRPELGLQMGSSQLISMPTEAKLALVRLYERMSGREILPKELV